MSSAAPLPSEPAIRLLDLAREIREAFADRDELRREIASYLRNSASAPRLAALGRALLIDPPDFRELLRNSDLLLAMAWGTAADLHGKKIPAQLSISGGLARHVRAGGFAAAVVEGNSRGELHEGLIRFDAKTLAAVSARLEAGVDLRGHLERDRDDISRAVTIRPGAAVEVETITLSDRATPALEAVTAAVEGFIFPWQIPALFRQSGGRSPMGGRIVRIGGTRSISIAGRFRWGRAIFALGAEDDPISLGGGAVGARFSAKLEGDFQIVIEPRGDDRVTVSVSRRRSSDQRVRASATASVGFDGAERVARAALERLAGDAAQILGSIEQHPERWTDLRALFHAAAEERADRVLARSAVTAQIEEWLRSVSIRVELRRRLRRIAAELLGEAAAVAIDALEERIEPAIDVVRSLILPLHRALSKIRTAIDAAARSRIEVELALSRNRSAANEVAFAFEVDPVAAESPFLDMLRGDFAIAFRLAETDSEDVRLVGGTFVQSGSLEIESSLTIAAFGLEIGNSTLLRQEWDAEVAATGDVLIGVRTSLESERRRWRSLRAARVLVESAFLAELDARERLIHRDGDDLLTLESEIEFEPSEEELRELERRLISLGALSGPTSMLRDLVLEGKRIARRPFGRLETVAVLRLSWEDLRSVALLDLDLSRSTFAHHLFRWAPPPAIPARLSAGGLPLFAWPSVLDWAAEGWPDSSRAIRFHDPGAVHHVDVPPGHPARALYLYARTVLFFGRAILQLRAMATPANDPAGLEQMSRRLRHEHRTLVRELGLVVGFVDSAIGEVLLSTFLDLLPPENQAEAFVVVRREDGKRFVYQ
jgi:hypothetical protein